MLRWALIGLLPGLLVIAVPAQEPPTPPTAEGRASNQARRVEHAVDVVRQWLPHQHLYVKGDLGLDDERLGELEQWLDQHAPHWTVVLLESADNEHFTDAAGQPYTGMDAVEHALGKGLPSLTPFGQWTDPRTGERDGAFFILFLKESQFSYYGSDAQDRRGLGEDHWAGQLDSSAIAAMRGGGRIADAVKDTLTHIDQELGDLIAREAQQRQRRAADDQIALEQARAQANASRLSASAAVALLTEEATALRLELPRPLGDIPRPDTASMQADLSAAEKAFDAGDCATAKALADGVRQKAQDGLNRIANHRSDLDVGPGLQRTLDNASRHPRRAKVEAALFEASTTLAAAREAYERADSGYVEHFARARQQVEAVAARLRAADQAAKLRRQLAWATAGALGLAVLGMGLLLNLRRRPSRREASALVDAWTRALDEKADALFALLDRAHALVGANATDAGRRFSGLTLDLSQGIIRDVDELIIMSACAQRLLRDASSLVTPVAAKARVANLFRTRNYRAAIRRLRDEPIAFRPEEGLELVVRGRKSERDTLLGDLQSYEPFTLSFDQLMATFQERAARALACLERVEGCLSRLHANLETTRERLRQAHAAESDLTAAPDGTAPFCLRPVFAELLPAAATAVDEALHTAVRDPVTAFETAAATADRQAVDALALTQLALDYRRRLHPRLEAVAQQLARVPVATAWLDAAVESLSQRADTIAEMAIQLSVGKDIEALHGDLEAVAERAVQVLALDQVRRDTALPAAAEAEALVTTARSELAEALALKPEAVLCEAGQDPSERLSQAREELAGAKAALERGDVDATRSALDGVTRRVGEATALVAATRQAFAAHADTLTARRQETDRLQQALPEHQRILADIEAVYAPSVLLLGQGDPAHPNANGTVQDNLREAQEALMAARALADQAAEAHRAGRLLEAAGRLDQAAGCQAQADVRLREIAEKQTRLRDTEAANESLGAQLATQIQALAATIEDGRTRHATIQAFAAAQQRLAETQRHRQAPPQDPFHVAAALAEVAQALAAVTEQARGDWDLHAEAGRSLQAAVAQVDVARRLAQAAEDDALADSPAIREAAGPGLTTGDAALEQAQRAIAVPHADWAEVDALADRATLEAGRVAATLRDELTAAQAALGALSAAGARVREAAGWVGAFGVSIPGSPGAELLDQARLALQDGDYRHAAGCAEAARRMAVAALAAAAAEAERRRRAEEARLARERREREAAEAERRRRAFSTPSFGSSSFGRSSFGSSSFGRSSFSSHSGVSRSSFSSGSGVRRSGW